MEPTPNPKIKICCISSVEEARLAIRFGADAIGLVGNMPSGPGVISESLIAEIARTIPPSIGTFLLTSEQSLTQTDSLQISRYALASLSLSE